MDGTMCIEGSTPSSPSADSFVPVAPDAVRVCSGDCQEAKPSTAFPIGNGLTGARSSECRSCRDKRIRTGVGGSDGDDAIGHYRSGGRRETLRVQRQTVREAVTQVVKTHAGVAMTIRQIYKEVLDLLDIVPHEIDVKKILRDLEKEEPYLLKVGRDAYAWDPEAASESAVEQYRIKETRRVQRQAVIDTVSHVLSTHVGVAMTIRRVYEEAVRLLDFVPPEGDVRKVLSDLAKSDRRLVRAGRDAYLWAPDGKIGQLQPVGPRQTLRVQRQAISNAVSEVLRTRPGIALTISEIYEEAVNLLEFTPAESDVRRMLKDLAKSERYLVKVGRDAYAWAPDGVIPPRPAPPHVVGMIERRWRGDTLDEIGQAFGVTRERVRQLLKKYGGPSWAEVRRLQIEQAEGEERARQEAVATKIRTLLAGAGATTPEDVAAKTGLDAADVSKFWPTDLVHLRLWGHGSHESRWSDEEILEVIREAAIYEFPLTANGYAELLTVGQVTGPSLPRVSQRFGSWSAACDAAGVVSGQTYRPHYESQWGDEDILSIVRAYLEDPTAPNSIQGYDVWKRANAPDGPSGQTIRNRFRSWTAVKRLALTTSSIAREEPTHE
ncbi:hypothetical protein GA707_06545 [Nostocoides sp. F2B08]|uniref:sigma factor-like helix-turn-helix DNA-binding protein n=1 Tax=Nostocoides sp. F2B08 TaxID=2653936 RepID=UPI001262C164|nr:sigma factor-like helix-turn-helix DNA-binding protein [Tetrasphaera sp. F2B08]KAB7745563.1 hypothetical protein GA707_06545 [Tetrasphaera sp. F2B08]